MRALAITSASRFGAGLAALVVLCASVSANAAEGSDEHPPLLNGFNLAVDVWAVSGLLFASEAYESQATLYLQPTYALGKQHFKGRWLEGVSLSGRLLLTTEFTGNDPTFRTRHLVDPSALGEVRQPVAMPANADEVPRGIEGASRRMDVSDLQLGAFQDKAALIPKLDAKLQAGVRVVVPLSLQSRNFGLYTVPSIYLGIARKVGPIELSFGTRANYYLYATTLVPLPQDGATVVINGKSETPYTPGTDGTRLPHWALAHTLSATWELPHDLAVGLTYSLFNTYLRAFESCSLDGQPTVDTCADGKTVRGQGDVNQRDSGWFLASVDWKFNAYATLGLGLSTFRPLRGPAGELANPFLRIDRNNYSTAYLSFGLDAEGVAQAWQEQKK